MTESEKERERVAQAKQEQKRKLMQQIQEDIDQRKLAREAEEQSVIEERERLRLEQLEYERVKNQVAANLKQ